MPPFSTDPTVLHTAKWCPQVSVKPCVDPNETRIHFGSHPMCTFSPSFASKSLRQVRTVYHWQSQWLPLLYQRDEQLRQDQTPLPSRFYKTYPHQRSQLAGTKHHLQALSGISGIAPPQRTCPPSSIADCTKPITFCWCSWEIETQIAGAVLWISNGQVLNHRNQLLNKGVIDRTAEPKSVTHRDKSVLD